MAAKRAQVREKKPKPSMRAQLERLIDRAAGELEQSRIELTAADLELLNVGRQVIEQLDSFRQELAQGRHAVAVLTGELSQTNATVQTRLFWKLIEERDTMKNELHVVREQLGAAQRKLAEVEATRSRLREPTPAEELDESAKINHRVKLSTAAGVYCPATADHVCRRSDCVGAICMEAGK